MDQRACDRCDVDHQPPRRRHVGQRVDIDMRDIAGGLRMDRCRPRGDWHRRHAAKTGLADKGDHRRAGGILDPVDTRNALGIALSAALNVPIGPPRYGVFRM